MESSTAGISEVVGVDLGDRWSQVCVRSMASGEVLAEFRVRTTAAGLSSAFGDRPRSRLVLEVGTHSPWVSRLLRELGHEVVVANARKVRLISESRRKTDRIDAGWLSRLGRADVELLHPVTHRSVERQESLALLRSRGALVQARTQLILHCRGAVKSWGARLPSCDAKVFAQRVALEVPEPLRPALAPVLEQIASLTRTIRAMDREVERLATEQFPEATRLTQVRGVGSIVALTYVLSLGDPRRFARSRQVGAYLGLTPGQRDSGDRRHPQRITKEGDAVLRALLVQSAHYLLGPFGSDCDLRRYGERLLSRGGPGFKRRAVVAVARKLAVLLHRLWLSAEPYQPFYEASLKERSARTAVR
jgi:transposase